MTISEFFSFDAWTDYPFLDEDADYYSYINCPIRPITVIAFDGNKYAHFKYKDRVYSCQSGYIYSRYGRLGQVPVISKSKWNRLPCLRYGKTDETYTLYPRPPSLYIGRGATTVYRHTPWGSYKFRVRDKFYDKHVLRF